MNFKKIEEIIKSENKILIDYTSKLKTILNFDKFQSEKLSNKKYNNVVFLIQLTKLQADLKQILSVFCMGAQDIKHFIFLFNKDNYIYIDGSKIDLVHPKTIIKFLNIDDNDDDVDGNSTNCNICFDKSENSIMCRQCSFLICNHCFSDLKKNNNLCPACKCKMCD